MSVTKLFFPLVLASIPAFQFNGGVRLIDGPYRSEGRLQLYFFGVWGGVCGGSFGAVEADAVCNRLGYTRSRGTRAVSRYICYTVLNVQLSVFVTESVKTAWSYFS